VLFDRLPIIISLVRLGSISHVLGCDVDTVSAWSLPTWDSFVVQERSHGPLLKVGLVASSLSGLVQRHLPPCNVLNLSQDDSSCREELEHSELRKEYDCVDANCSGVGKTNAWLIASVA